jgi:hypothetical protein
MKKGQKDRRIGRFGPLTFTASCAADGSASIGQVLMKTSKPIVAQVGMSALTTMTASSAAAVVSQEDSVSAEYSAVAPLAYTSDGRFALSPSSLVEVGTNAPGSDCFFIGLLQNVGR